MWGRWTQFHSILRWVVQPPSRKEFYKNRQCILPIIWCNELAKTWSWVWHYLCFIRWHCPTFWANQVHGWRPVMCRKGWDVELVSWVAEWCMYIVYVFKTFTHILHAYLCDLCTCMYSYTPIYIYIYILYLYHPGLRFPTPPPLKSGTDTTVGIANASFPSARVWSNNLYSLE